MIALVDVLVHDGEYCVHLAQGLHDGRTVGCFLPRPSVLSSPA